MSRKFAPKKPGLMSRLRATTFLVGWGFIYCAGDPAFANPQGGAVVGGQATITTSGLNTLTIDQTSKVVIVDWNSFNIGKGETTRFVQPDATSTAVNRIGGNDPSIILGNLDANGQVILINGNGLLFGAGARINVGSLIATTHDASNADLMSGKANFGGAGSSTASITNNGAINASSGIVGLIAPAVANNGAIRARLGSVTLGAASQFALDFTGDGLISFPVDAEVLSRALDAGGNPVKALVVNRGRIEGATVLLTAQAAQDIVENAISAGGLIRATAVRQSGGSIILDGGEGAVSVSGALSVADTAHGATGGSIEVLGDSVTLGSTARLDASGDAGGGSILVGGDLHGAGPLRDATNTVVAAGATLAADAISSGDGGTVVVWADGATNFAGAISAKGGAAGGDGGFVETSGKRSLTVADGATVDTLAPKGAAGDWLLDPANITIAASGSGTLAEGLDTTDTTSSITISTATLDAATSNVVLAASHSITVSSPISLTNAGVGITFEGAGAAPTAGPSSGTTLSANITTNNGAVTIDGATTLAADVTVNAGTGAVDFAGAVDSLGGLTNQHSLAVDGSGPVTFGGAIGPTWGLTGLTTGAGTTTLNGYVGVNGVITFGGPVTLGSDVTINGGFTNNVTFLGAIDGPYSLTFTDLASTKFDGNVTAGGGLAVHTSTTLGGDVTVNAGTAAISFDGPVDGGYNLVLTTTGTMLLSTTVGQTTPLVSLSTGTGITQLGGNVTTTGVQSYGGPVQLVFPLIMNAGAGDVTFASTLQSSATPVDFNSLTVTTNGVATFDGVVDLGGELLRYGTGPTLINANITTASSQYYQGAVTLDASLLSSTDSTGSIQVGGKTTLEHDATVTALGQSILAGVDGHYNLTVDSDLDVLFPGAVGATTPLASLTTKAPTGLYANVTTTGAQSYGARVGLFGDVAITTSDAPVSFASTIDSYGPAWALSVTTGGGAQIFGGALGASHALRAVTLSSSDAASLSLPSVAASGPVTVATGGPLTLAGISTTGDILVKTLSGDLTIDGAVTTTSATATALTLEAGSAADRVASPGVADTNGDVVIASGGSLSIGAGGSGVIYTGSIAGSTGLSSVVGAGDFRYWSDTNGHTGYTTPLGSGISAVYREQPIVSVSVTAPGSGRTYDGTTTSVTPLITGLVNGDVGSATVSITSGGSPAVLRNAGSYTLNVTVDGDLAGLGYAVQSESASYTISPAILTAGLTGTVSKTIDGTTTASLTPANYTLSGTIYGSDVVALNDPASGAYADAHVGGDKTVTVTGLALDNPNYALASTTVSAAIGVISPVTATDGLTSMVATTHEAIGASNLAIPDDILTPPPITSPINFVGALFVDPDTSSAKDH